VQAEPLEQTVPLALTVQIVSLVQQWQSVAVAQVLITPQDDQVVVAVLVVQQVAEHINLEATSLAKGFQAE
jgi:hypothetical protein